MRRLILDGFTMLMASVTNLALTVLVLLLAFLFFGQNTIATGTFLGWFAALMGLMGYVTIDPGRRSIRPWLENLSEAWVGAAIGIGFLACVAVNVGPWGWVIFAAVGGGLLFLVWFRSSKKPVGFFTYFIAEVGTVFLGLVINNRVLEVAPF